MKKLSKKDNRPWVAFTLATKNASAPLNLFADSYAAYGAALAENAVVLVQGNIIVGTEGHERLACASRNPGRLRLSSR